MTQPFATREFDALDGFDLDDEFIDVGLASPRDATAPIGGEDVYNPVGRLVEETESAVSAMMPVEHRVIDAAPEPVVQPVAETLVPAAAVSAGLPVAAGATVEVSIPRIAVHVFAERQDTLAAAERAGQDRRMSRATTQIRIGGVGSE